MAADVKTSRDQVATRSWLIHAMLMSLLLAPATAHGAPTREPIIVLKARVGIPNPEDLDVITPIVDEQFEAEGFAARSETIERILGGRMPRSGILDRGVTAADIMNSVELGYEDWSHGLFADAVKKLRPAKARILRNPGLLVSDTKNLDSTFKGLVALSLSLLRTGKANEAAETMTELVRIFRTRGVYRNDWGLPAETYWRSISKPLLAGDTGQLYVTTGNDQAVVFIDGQIRGIGRADVADLVPGSHHVLVQLASTAGLQYSVELRPNENTKLDINWNVESALTVTEPWIGFVFATEAERNKEALFAGELAKRWGGQGMVVVIGTLRIQDASALIGTLYRADGRLIRSAATILEGEISGQVRRLTRYLADGSVGSGLKVFSRGPGEPLPSIAVSAPDARSSRLPKVVGGAGAAAITIGAVEYIINPYETSKPGNGKDDGRDPYVGVMLGGSLLLGGGTYLWLRESQRATQMPSGIMGVGVASFAAGAVLYLTDQDRGPYAPPIIRDTATAGIALGASGLALTGFGLWLMHRDGPVVVTSGVSAGSEATWVPAVSVDASHAFAGMYGSF